jgi:hypothetical protein
MPANLRPGAASIALAIARLPPDDATRRDLDRVAAVRQLDRRGSFVGFERRFPPPWTTEETDGCFIVKDRDGQKLAYCRRAAAHLLTRDEAPRA